MPFAIVLAPEAVEDLKRLRGTVKDAMETHLRHEPEKTSRSRIKRLRGLSRPQYRLRIGEVRVFYDVAEGEVEVLAIVPKSETAAWLAQFGKL
jgi:mRNA interferase RelE/StbE